MTPDSSDRFNLALVQLQTELAQLAHVQQALKAAHQRLVDAEREWQQLTIDQKVNAQQLVSATKSAIQATDDVTHQARSLTQALIPLARAMASVDFEAKFSAVQKTVEAQSAQVRDEIGLLHSAAVLNAGRIKVVGWSLGILVAINTGLLFKLLLN